MRQCIFPSCKSRPDDRVGNVAMVHRFPREEHIQKQWIQWIHDSCGLPDFQLTPKSGLCYRHFDRRCYHRSNGLLKPFSYPSYTPQDLDNIALYGSSALPLARNGVPKTSLIIKVDPTLMKNSMTEKTDPSKKFVLLVTDSATPNHIPNSASPTIPNVGMIRPQDIPPLRLIGRDRTALVSDLVPSNQDRAHPVVDANESCSSDIAPRSPRSINLIQTVLNSSRRRIRVYRRRLQQENKRKIKLEELLDQLKKEELISVEVADKIEAVLHDD